MKKTFSLRFPLDLGLSVVFLSHLGRYVPVVNVYVPLRILRHVCLSLLLNFVVGL